MGFESRKTITEVMRRGWEQGRVLVTLEGLLHSQSCRSKVPGRVNWKGNMHYLVSGTSFLKYRCLLPENGKQLLVKEGLGCDHRNWWLRRWKVRSLKESRVSRGRVIYLDIEITQNIDRRGIGN